MSNLIMAVESSWGAMVEFCSIFLHYFGVSPLIKHNSKHTLQKHDRYANKGFSESNYMFLFVGILIVVAILFFPLMGQVSPKTELGSSPEDLSQNEPATIETLVESVSERHYRSFHDSVESMGLGEYGGDEYNMGFRNRDYDIDLDAPTPGNEEAALYLKDKFTEMGLIVSVQGKYKNVVGELKGSLSPEKIYILGAHYDHVAGDMPGGDDNASGTAGLLEAARVLSQHTFESTIRFVAFNAEEDHLLGSADYVDKVAQHENIVAMINYDMILRPGSDAMPDRPIDVEVETNDSMDLANGYMQAVTDYVPSLAVGDIISGDDSWSDNDSFRNAGIASMLVIENSTGDWYAPNPIANSYYHHYEDATDRLANDPNSPSAVTYDFDFATDVTRATVALLAQEAVLSE